MDITRLKKTIVERNTTIEAVAKAANMDRSTFYRKLKNGGRGFTVEEVKTIACTLGLTGSEATDIFFTA